MLIQTHEVSSMCEAHDDDDEGCDGKEGSTWAVRLPLGNICLAFAKCAAFVCPAFHN